MPEITNIPKCISLLIVHIINNLNNISFTELDRDFVRLTNLSLIEDDLCIFTEFKDINKFLFSYYHNNQNLNFNNYQRINQLEHSIVEYEQLSKIHEDLASKYNYYESSYHHFQIELL